MDEHTDGNEYDSLKNNNYNNRICTVNYKELKSSCNIDKYAAELDNKVVDNDKQVDDLLELYKDESIFPISCNRVSAYFNKKMNAIEHYLMHFKSIIPYMKCEHCEMLKRHLNVNGVMNPNNKLLYEDEDDFNHCLDDKITNLHVSNGDDYISIGQISDINKLDVNDELEYKDVKIALAKGDDALLKGELMKNEDIVQVEESVIQENITKPDTESDQSPKEEEVIETVDVSNDELNSNVDESGFNCVLQHPLDTEIKNDEITCCSVSRNKSCLVTGTRNGFINLWVFHKDDTETNSEVDGKSYKMKIITWRLLNTKPNICVKGHDNGVTSIYVNDSDECNYIITSIGGDLYVKLWRFDGVKLTSLAETMVSNNPPIHGAYINDMLITSSNGKIETWEIVDRELKKTSKSTKTCKSLSHVSTSPSGKHIAVGGKDGIVMLYRVNKLKQIGTIECKTGDVEDSITGIAWNKSETAMCITNSKIRLVILDGKKSKCIEEFKCNEDKNCRPCGFYGTENNYLMCISKSSAIYTWKCTSTSKGSNEVIKINKNFTKFKSNMKSSQFIDIYNMKEWDYILKLIRQLGADVVIQEGCLGCGKRSMKLNGNKDLLLLTSNNGHEIYFSTIRQ